MAFQGTPELMGEAFNRAINRLRQQRVGELKLPRASPRPRPFTIAVSREAGAGGQAIALELGRRTGWTVYDRNLLDEISRQADLRKELLETVDEKYKSWVVECLEALHGAPVISQAEYQKHLVQVLRSLASHGECIIVGRGATAVLPTETTLRVRLVAPLARRVARVAGERALSQLEAARYVREADDQRTQFVQECFHHNPSEAEEYDLVLNSARYSDGRCAELILEALQRLQAEAESRKTLPETPKGGSR